MSAHIPAQVNSQFGAFTRDGVEHIPLQNGYVEPYVRLINPSYGSWWISLRYGLSGLAMIHAKYFEGNLSRGDALWWDYPCIYCLSDDQNNRRVYHCSREDFQQMVDGLRELGWIDMYD